jgi:hypothetical protein
MTGRKKGTVKTGGRKRGRPNKITTDLRECIKAFLEKNWPLVQSKFEKLEPKDQLLFLERLLQYSIPKMQSVSMNLKGDIKEMTEQEIDQELERLKVKTKNSQ